MDSYVIISTERLALQVFGRCPIALCATCDIDGCGKMSLQANIFPYGRITSRASTALKMPRVSENIASQYCGDIPPPTLLCYHKKTCFAGLLVLPYRALRKLCYESLHDTP